MVSRAASSPEHLLADLRAACAFHGIGHPSLTADIDASPTHPLINLGSVSTSTAARLARVLREAAR